jgi:ribosomal protein S18 acetylase RimI-like enzyme
MKKINIRVTYMEMREFAAETTPIPDGYSLQLWKHPEPEGYLELYDRVGSDLNWVDRKLLPEAELIKRISPDYIEIYILYQDAEIVGYAEINKQDPKNIELCYFGIVPAFRGKGLGKALLSSITAIVRSCNPDRFWLHTCELDHPAAIPNYEHMGFRIYETRIEEQLVAEPKLS